MHKSVVIAILLAGVIAAQNPNTPIYPGGIATDNDLLVASNNADATLVAPVTATGTTIILSTATRFVTPMSISIGAEIMRCLTHVGTTYTCQRGFDGTTAAIHIQGVAVHGYFVAWPLNQVNSEVKAIETALGPNLSNIPSVGTIPLSAAALASNSSRQIIAATTTGSGSVVLSLNPSLTSAVLGTPVSVNLANATNLPLATGVAGVLSLANGGTGSALTPSNGGIFYSTASGAALLQGTANAGLSLLSGANGAPTWGQANNSSGAWVSASAYNFPAQGPGGALIVGNNSITMTPVPAGVNGTDANHQLWVSGGTGTAEGCLITGGSGSATQASGIIIINCANTHSGAWTIKSATNGEQEAFQATGLLSKVVTQSPAGADLGTLTIPQSNTLVDLRRLNGATSVATTVDTWFRSGQADARSVIGSIFPDGVLHLGHMFSSYSPVGSTYFGDYALAGYSRSDQVSTLPVGMFSIGHAGVSGVHAFGFNAIALQTINGTTGDLAGGEIDVEYPTGWTGNAAGSTGLFINTFNAVHSGTAIQTGSINGFWDTGISFYGLHPASGIGIGPGAGETMKALIDTGAATYSTGAIIMENSHRIVFEPLAGGAAQAYIASNNHFRLVGGPDNTVHIRSNDDQVAGTIEVGQVNLATGSQVCVVRSGTGSPNGTISGNPCDLYTNTSGGAGTTLYVKESGIGNTSGWVGK